MQMKKGYLTIRVPIRDHGCLRSSAQGLIGKRKQRQGQLILILWANVRIFERATEEYYLFAMACARLVIDGLVAPYIHRETHEMPLTFRGIMAARVEIEIAP